MRGTAMAGADMEALRDRVSELASGMIGSGATAGLAVRAHSRGIPFFKGAWGLARNEGTEREPMEEGTYFDLASLTKIFTATAIMRLASLGAADIESTSCDILFPRHRSDRDINVPPLILGKLGRITVRDLLLHSSGLHYWHPFYASGKTGFYDILEEVVRRYPPAEGTVYSDLNFMILGKAVEAAAGQAFDLAMRDIVFGPLGLAGPRFGHPKITVEANASVAATEFGNRIERGMVEALGLGYSGWRDEARAIRGEADDGNCRYYFDGVAGHAGIFARAEDVCALGDLYSGPAARAARGYDGFLSEEFARGAGLDRGAGRGLGFQTGDLYPRGGFGHSGFTGTWLYVNPGAELSLAVLANRLHTGSPVNINGWRKRFAELFLEYA